jgi:hypothetical protein
VLSVTVKNLPNDGTTMKRMKNVALSCLEVATAMPTTLIQWTRVTKDANRLYHQWIPNPPSPSTKISEPVGKEFV